ncbi:MAG: hypothetical protein HKN26_13930 [Acidimicrobiales bacterium]|nr:hypothetical protein [Acidimicrobiales bacterium]
MTRRSSTAALTVGLFLAVLVIMNMAGAININWPWNSLDLNVASTETDIRQPELTQATIIGIDPISLDCRARITAAVPVEGTKEHKLLGQTYRTDRVTLTAIGDIDTCVDSGAAVIETLANGTYRVTIPAESIRFERPRVDAGATQDSVHFSKGWIGKITDVAPWVSENSELTPAGYTFAQAVVGSSECMAEAYEVTEQVILDAYHEEFATQGADPSRLEVTVEGTPNFSQHAMPHSDDMNFEVADDGIDCAVDTEAFGGAEVVTEPNDAA